MDTAYCAELLQFRDKVGMPLGFLSEGHGWFVAQIKQTEDKAKEDRWHILTGFGVYYYVVFIEYLRLCIPTPSESIQKKRGAILIWPSIFSLPRVELVREKSK